MADYKIYQATHLPSRKIYIGLTKAPLLKRIGQHLGLTEYKRSEFQKFLHTTKYEEWTWDVLYTVRTSSEAYKLEADVIKDFLSQDIDLLNVLGVERIKEDPTAWLHPHQFKKNMVPWNRGKTGHLSEETVLKMRIAKLRKPTRVTPSAETIAKIKQTQGTRVRCIETGEEFASIGEAALRFSAARSGIRRALNGASCAGYTFERILT